MTCETCVDPCASAEVVWPVRQGALFLRRLRIAKVSGASFDLTGYAVRCQFRRNHFESNAAAVATPTCTIVDAARGVVDVRLGATATTLLYDGGVFDVEVYDPNDLDVVYRVYQGRWTTDLEATLGA